VFQLLKNRGVLFLSLSNFLAQLDSRLTHMVIITLVGAMFPGRLSAFSGFAVAYSLPVIILAPFVGVLVDHWNRKSIMVRSHLIQTVLICLTPSCIRLTHSYIPIWVMVVLFFSLEVFYNTARNSSIPDLVAPADLIPANAIITAVARVATFLGMVAGAFLIKTTGWNWGFYLDGLVVLAAGLLVLGMGSQATFEPAIKIDFSLGHRLKKSLQVFGDDLKELGRLIIRDRLVIFVMISVCVLPFVSAIAYTVLVYLIQQQFRLGTVGVGLFGGVIGLGMLAGALLMGFLGRKISRGWIIIGSIALLAALFLVGPLFVSPLFLYLVALVSGLVYSLVGVAQDTLLQEDVAKEIRGRVFGTKEFFINLTFTLSAVFVGILGSRVAPYTVVTWVGIILVGVTVFSAFIFNSIPPEIRARL
jgi:MFS family permease